MRDLTSDISSLQSARNVFQKNTANFCFLHQLTKEKLDSIEKVNGSLYYSSSVGTTKISNGDYEGFKSSGKIGLIENKDLKKDILKYYQEVTPDMLEAEKINAEQVLKMTDLWNENANRDYKTNFLDPRFIRGWEQSWVLPQATSQCAATFISSSKSACAFGGNLYSFIIYSFVGLMCCL